MSLTEGQAVSLGASLAETTGRQHPGTATDEQRHRAYERDRGGKT